VLKNILPWPLKLFPFYGFSIFDAQLSRRILPHSNTLISGLFRVLAYPREAPRHHPRLLPHLRWQNWILHISQSERFDLTNYSPFHIATFVIQQVYSKLNRTKPSKIEFMSATTVDSMWCVGSPGTILLIFWNQPMRATQTFWNKHSGSKRPNKNSTSQNYYIDLFQVKIWALNSKNWVRTVQSKSDKISE